MTLTLFASYDNQRISCFSQQITAMAHEKSGGSVTTAYMEVKIKDIIWMAMKNCNNKEKRFLMLPASLMFDVLCLSAS